MLRTLHTAIAQDLSPLRIALAGLTALAVAMGIGRFAFTPVLPMMQEDAGLSVGAGAWLASANYIGYLIGALTAMMLRIRASTVIRGSLAAIALLTLAMGIEPGVAASVGIEPSIASSTGLRHDFIAWLLLRALAGIASAWVLVFASAWCMERLAAQGKSALNGIVFAGVGIGIAAAGVVCIALMQVRASSAQAWIVLGVGALAATATIWPVFAADPARSTGSSAHASTPMRWNRETVRMVLCYGAFGFGYIIPATFLPAMAKQVIRDPALFGWSWPLFGAAAALSTLALVAVRRAGDNRRLWSIGQAVMAFGVILPVLWPGLGAVMLAALCVGGTFMLVTMVAMQEARQVAGVHARGLIAVMTAAFALGQIIGPLTVSADGFAAALLVAGALLAASAAALAFPSRKE